MGWQGNPTSHRSFPTPRGAGVPWNGNFPKLKPGGLLCGDDYGVKGWWDHGVTRAVDEFVASRKCEAVGFKRGQFILRKPAS